MFSLSIHNFDLKPLFCFPSYIDLIIDTFIPKAKWLDHFFGTQSEIVDNLPQFHLITTSVLV